MWVHVNVNLYADFSWVGGILYINLCIFARVNMLKQRFLVCVMWRLVLPDFSFPISISDLAIPVKVPTLCVSTPGPCGPACLIAAWWTAINPWWRGWGIFMYACQQWHDTLLGWIICLPYTGSNCWVQFTAKWFLCACWCVRLLIGLQCVCCCLYSKLCVGSGAFWYPEVSSRRRVLHPSLTSDKPPAHRRAQCLSSSLCVMHGISLLPCICFLCLSS